MNVPWWQALAVARAHDPELRRSIDPGTHAVRDQINPGPCTSTLQMVNRVVARGSLSQQPPPGIKSIESDLYKQATFSVSELSIGEGGIFHPEVSREADIQVVFHPSRLQSPIVIVRMPFPTPPRTQGKSDVLAIVAESQTSVVAFGNLKHWTIPNSDRARAGRWWNGIFRTPDVEPDQKNGNNSQDEPALPSSAFGSDDVVHDALFGKRTLATYPVYHNCSERTRRNLFTRWHHFPRCAICPSGTLFLVLCQRESSPHHPACPEDAQRKDEQSPLACP